MKKKLLVTILTLALTASFVGCGPQKIEPAKNNNAESEAPAEEASSEASSADVAEEASSASSESSESGDSISGEIDGNTYTNKYFGVKIALDNNYHFATDEELQTLNSTITDLNIFSDNAAAKKALDNGTVMIVTYAVDGTTGKTLNVVLQSVGTLTGALANEQSLLEAGKKDTISALEAQGLTDVTATMETVTFMGEEHPSLLLTAKVNGADLYQRCICLIKDGYIANFTASGLDKEQFDKDLLSATKLGE